MILNARRLRSGHLQRKNYFKFANRENLRIFPIDFFTGGVVKANGICSACFLRERRRCGELFVSYRSASLIERVFGKTGHFAVLPKAPSPRGLSAKRTGGSFLI